MTQMIQPELAERVIDKRYEDFLNELDAKFDRLDAKFDKILRLALATCALAWLDAALIFALLIIRW